MELFLIVSHPIFEGGDEPIPPPFAHVVEGEDCNKITREINEGLDEEVCRCEKLDHQPFGPSPDSLRSLVDFDRSVVDYLVDRAFKIGMQVGRAYARSG